MAEKSPRRQKLEESLKLDPADTFLRYGVAVQCLREGDVDEGRSRLRDLIADHPDDQVAAHQQLGQSFLDSSEVEAGVQVLRAGIALARERGDWHAASEMEGLIAGSGS